MEQNFYEKGTGIQRYVDILTNGGFKALFGDVANKEVVMSIINVLLPAHRKVTEIEYLPTEYQGQVVDLHKEYHYDFMCKDVSGAMFIVELQRYQDDYWFNRCVSYACRVYDRQNRKGENYNIPPVYLIGLMGVPIEHHNAEYCNQYSLMSALRCNRRCSRYCNTRIHRKRTAYELVLPQAYRT